MKRLILLLASTALIIALHPASSFAYAQWEAGIKIYYADDSQTLAFGADPTATDGFENRWETRALLGGYLQAYFYHPEWGLDTPYYWRDIRNMRLPKQWVFYAASSYIGRQITLKWDISNVPATVNLSLVDEFTGAVIDMRAQPSYAYVNPSSETKTFKINVTGLLPSQDVTPPDTVITPSVAPYINTSSLAISYSGTDDVSGPDALQFAYKIDDSPWSVWTSVASITLDALSDGSHIFSVKARDEAGNEDPTPAEAKFIVDTVPPALTLNQPDPATLWPPNGKMVDVVISGNAIDEGSGVTGSVSYAAHDEYNEIKPAGTAVVNADGSFSFTVSLKAERDGKDLDGRAYTITINAVDKAGNASEGNITVTVPHDMGR